MSALDLTEAVEAAARMMSERQNGPGSWDGLDGYARYMWSDGVLPVIAAAAPIVAAQVRAQIIETLHAERDEITGSRGPQDETIAAESAFLSGLDRAIEVIEGGAR